MPTVEDFSSNEALGRPMRPPDTERRRRLWRGVSLFDDLAHAREQAMRRGLGPYLAVVVVGPEDPIQVEQQGIDPHHFTAWGSAEALLERVESVVPVGAG